MRFPLVVAIAISLFIANNSFAVQPPSVEVRNKAEASRQKEVKQIVKEQRASGCVYGKDVKTGKCYEPRQGQFYRDPVTGKVKVKKIDKVNLPWNQDKAKPVEKPAEKKSKI